MLFDASARTTFQMNANDPDADAYMDLSNEDQSVMVNGKYRFKLTYDSTITVEWWQSSWLTSSTIQGFQCISPADCGPSSQLEISRFVGLGATGDLDLESVLDGNGATLGWWNSVGVITTHHGGMPGWNKQIQSTMALYVAVQAPARKNSSSLAVILMFPNIV